MKAFCNTDEGQEYVKSLVAVFLIKLSDLFKFQGKQFIAGKLTK